jgi:hypothetical protein
MKSSGQIPATQPRSVSTIYMFASVDLNGTMSKENPTIPPRPNFQAANSSRPPHDRGGLPSFLRTVCSG